jgi:hypothetical protein
MMTSASFGGKDQIALIAEISQILLLPLSCCVTGQLLGLSEPI